MVQEGLCHCCWQLHSHVFLEEEEKSPMLFSQLEIFLKLVNVCFLLPCSVRAFSDHCLAARLYLCL